MKLKLLSAAVSAIGLMGFAQSSQAFDMYLAGSSAQDNAVLQEVYNLCTPASFVLYLDKETSGSNYKAYSCTLNANAGAQAGQAATFHKVNLGGSGVGVAPLFSNTAVNTMVPGAACVAAASNSKLPNGVAVPTQVCPTTGATSTLAAHILDAGVSDLNPTIFQGDNTVQYYANGNLNSFNPVTAVPAGFSVSAGPVIIWGVPVSQKLYTALQVAQGLLNYGGIYSNSNSPCVAGSYGYSVPATGLTTTTTAGVQTITTNAVNVTNAADACMPSLSIPQMTTLISGGVTDWSNVYTTLLTNLGAALPAGTNVNLVTAATDYDLHVAAASQITPTNLGGDTLINFCQRLAGSGTAAGQYAYFLNQPANQTTAVAPAGNVGQNVYLIGDSGNMEKCLNDIDQGTNTAVDAAGNVLTVDSGEASGYIGWAFGQQSTDKNVTLSNHYRFIKINNFAPTQLNAFNGYDNFVNQATWQYPTTCPAGRSNECTLVQTLISNSANPYSVFNDLGQYATQQFAQLSGTFPLKGANVTGYAGFMGSGSVALAVEPGYKFPSNLAIPNGAVANQNYAGSPAAPVCNSLKVVDGCPVLGWTHGAANGSTLDNGAFENLNTNFTIMP